MFDENGTAAGRMLVFRVGVGRFAIDLDWVRGVRESADLGSGNARGENAPLEEEPLVCDPRAWGWGGSDAAAAGARAAVALVIGREGERMVLLVDAAEGLAEALEIRRWPAWIAPLAGAEFSGLAVQSDGVLLVIDPEIVLGAGPGANPGSSGEAVEA